jgi:hypothetical protein
MPSLSQWYDFRRVKVAKVLRSMPIVAFAIFLLLPSCAFAAGPEISVSCGGADTRMSIRTGRQLRNVSAIRISVDPANKCHVDVSVELEGGARDYRSARIRARMRHSDQSTSNTPDSRCFVFSGRSYCE